MELAGGFTDEKRFVDFGDEFEVVREGFLEPVESAALRPVSGRGEVFEPCLLYTSPSPRDRG